MNRTQQIDLAFNIFFMVYFFIRVRVSMQENCTALSYVTIHFTSVHRRERQVLVHAGALLLRRLLHHSALFRLHLLGQDVDR